MCSAIHPAIRRFTQQIVLVLAIVASALAFAIKPSGAEPNATAFLEMYDGGDQEARQTAEFGISMIEIGLEWANTEATRRTQPLFCLPPKLVMTASQLIDVVRRGIEEDRRLGLRYQIANLPLGAALLVSLERVFPC